MNTNSSRMSTEWAETDKTISKTSFLNFTNCKCAKAISACVCQCITVVTGPVQIHETAFTRSRSHSKTRSRKRNLVNREFAPTHSDECRSIALSSCTSSMYEKFLDTHLSTLSCHSSLAEGYDRPLGQRN
jgi:hypothetical protein